MESVYRHWQPGGVRVAFGDVVFDSTVHCGAGYDFRQIGPSHFRFRARPGLAHYSWRLHLRIESPGDGREVTLEVADFNHFGQELWQEQASVLSRDGTTWSDLGTDRIRLVPWTPTGAAADDASIDDGWHPPYGVQYRLCLDAPTLWLASPTPYTLQHNRESFQALARRCDFFTPVEIGRTHHFQRHGFPILAMHVARPGPSDGRLRVVVLAGEHAAEVAGMYACEGLLEEILRTNDLLVDFSFWVVPVVNVDGVALGKSYYNVDPADPAAPGVNLARDWEQRTQPEVQAVWRLIEDIRPHCVIALHNGRHRREYEAFTAPQPHLAQLLTALREHLPVPLEHWKPSNRGQADTETRRAGLTDMSLCFETLLLQKLPQTESFRESYRRTGICLLRGLVAGLRDVYSRPRLRALSDPLGTTPLRLQAPDFVATLPSFYYDQRFDTLRDHSVRNFEVNGLPLTPGCYDVHLRMQPGTPHLMRRRAGGTVDKVAAADGWVLLPSLSVPARRLAFEFVQEAGAIPFTEALMAPEAMPLADATAAAVPFTRYVRRTLSSDTPQFADWQPFYAQLMRPGFGLAELRAMFQQIVVWVASRQVCDRDSPYYGAIWSEEDKYDARDAAAAAACFSKCHRLTRDPAWLERARATRAYVYRSQVHEPGNERHDGGFVHLVQGIWGVHFNRLEPPYPGIDGVDTCAIIHQLCRAVELGFSLAPVDRDVLRRAAGWIASNEPLPGVFLHHEGSTHDCQNANALALSALVRAYHTLVAAGDDPPAAWLVMAQRGLRHYLEGQEAIGVWPYIFAQVGHRGQAFHFDNIPDHGIGLVHLTRVADRPPLDRWPGLHGALRRAARWYLGVSRVEGDTIDLDYDRRPDLGDDICFSGFTWCRFTAAATLTRIARLTGEVEPWRHLALRLMEHVARKRWQTRDPGRAPVVAHARPEAKLATWCQAAEWDASLLSELIEDLEALEG